ncbi:hypothetical protein D030_4749B, partial [Vibrio parahaemolyticus AQ3810]
FSIAKMPFVSFYLIGIHVS